VTLHRVGSGFIQFTTEAPGKVAINSRYDTSLGKKQFCKETGHSAYLSGASFESPLATRSDGGRTKGETFNLISPGTYKIQVTGCYGWEIVVSNA